MSASVQPLTSVWTQDSIEGKRAVPVSVRRLASAIPAAVKSGNSTRGYQNYCVSPRRDT